MKILKPNFLILILFFCVLVLTNNASAQKKQTLIKNTNTRAYGWVASSAVMGNHLYIIYRHPKFGLELFKINLSNNKLSLVKDIFPGAKEAPVSDGEYNAYQMVALGNKIIFTANDGVTGPEIWVSDGTSAGTTILKDIVPGNAGSSPENLTVVGNKVYFIAYHPATGYELWFTDGTTDGTNFHDINFGADDSYPYNFFVDNNNLYFSAENNLFGNEPWVVSSITNIPSLLKDIYLGNDNSYPGEFFKALGQVFFTANDGVNGYELWKTDGTNLGTVLVKDIFAGGNSSYPFGFAQNGTFLYFIANSVSNNVSEIWRTDGTNAGTAFVETLSEGQVSGGGEYYSAALNGKYLFGFSNDGLSGQEIYSSSGFGNLELLKQIGKGVFDGFVYFLGQTTVNGTTRQLFSGSNIRKGDELWSTDGTRQGTKLLRDLFRGKGSSYPEKLLQNGNDIYFYASSKGKKNPRLAIFKTNGTATGTKRLLNLPTGKLTEFNGISIIEKVGKRIFFNAESIENGRELWVTNGTSKGTFMVKDLANGSFNSSPGSFKKFGKNRLFFRSRNIDAGSEPHISNGTKKGTKMLSDIYNGKESSSPTPLGFLNKKMLFSSNGSLGRELYATNGKPSGTALVKDINAGENDGITINQAVVSNNQLFFAGKTEATGDELWKSDGSEAGTIIVKDIRVGASGSQPREFEKFKNGVLFSAITNANGRELFFSDGSAVGTQMIKDIYAGAVGSNPSNTTSNLDGTFALFSANDGVIGAELWITDGTEIGTKLLKDLRPGNFSSSPSDFIAFSNKLAFTANNSDRRDVWVSDGTEVGTIKVYDQNILGGSVRTKFATKGNKFYFTVDDKDDATEVWESDGTLAGTKIISKLSSGSEGVATNSFGVEVLGKKLLVFYRSGRNGGAVYSIRIN